MDTTKDFTRMPDGCPVCGAKADRVEKYMTDREDHAIVERWGCHECHSEWQLEFEWATGHVVEIGEDAPKEARGA